MQADQLPKNTSDVAEKLNAAHSVEKANNREMFLRILQNISFLPRQQLALRGGTDGEDSNFTQLLRLRTFDCPAVADWMEKKQNKYTSVDIQNEVFQIMALTILREISSSIRESGWLTMMANECTDQLIHSQHTSRKKESTDIGTEERKNSRSATGDQGLWFCAPVL